MRQYVTATPLAGEENDMRFETLAIHADHATDPTTGAVTPPLHLSTTFEREGDGSYPHGYIYIRTENPTRVALEHLLATLEGGAEGAAEAAAFASGSAATAAVFQSLAPGDHVLAPSDVYHGTAKQLRTIFAPWGLAVDFVDMSDLAAVEAALRPATRLVWVETPSNPLLKISDIERICALAHGAGAMVACDNTWATPVAQRPLALGADLVVHSTTKYLGGHSDTLGGAVVARAGDDRFARIRQIQGSVGAVLSPFDSWLTLRGIRTLAYRMRGHTEHALAVARFLAEHPAVAAVHYPGLPCPRGACGGGAPNVAVWRHALDADTRRSRDGAGGSGAHPHLYTGDESGRRRKPDRASRQHRRARVAHPAESAAPLDWPGASR